MTAALCPGSFDPPTNGHIDVIERCLGVFDRVVVAVVRNPSKEPMFSVEDRVDMIRKSFGGRVEVESFDGLLVDFAKAVGVDVIVKGLRAVGDFDYELQMAQMNRELSGVETLLMSNNPAYSFLSSSLVKEVATYGGDVSGMVPEVVHERLKAKLPQQR